MNELELIDELLDNNAYSEDWMKDFLTNVKAFYEERGFLTTKQKQAINNIYDHCEMVDNISHIGDNW